MTATMMNVQRVFSLRTPGLEPYLTLRENTLHWRNGFFVAEGKKVVLRLIESGMSVVSFLMSDDWFASLGGVLQDERYSDSTVFIASDDLMRSIVGYQLHQNILAIGKIPANPSIKDLVCQSSETKRMIALEGISDAENMGSIMRNAGAFGIWSLIVGRDSCSPYLRRSVRVSMASVFSLSIHVCANLSETLLNLQNEFGFSIIGTSPCNGINSLESFRSKAACLVFGSESNGLTDETLNLCDALFSIPMSPHVSSLNVSNAVAVTLYESLRQ